MRGQIGRIIRLLTHAGPDDVVKVLRSAPADATAPTAGFHLFPCGGLRKAGEWPRSYRMETPGPMSQAPPAIGLRNP